MTPELAVALAQFAVKFGIDAAIAFAKGMQGATIDDAIKALEEAGTKTAQMYLDEAKKALQNPVLPSIAAGK